jgi:4-amino-4-deoxy-L-arabinose transferase-like glycosyltransferase
MMLNSIVHHLTESIEKTWLQLLVLAAICLCSFFVHLNAHDVDLMEARNFVTAREIVQNKNWLVPTLNGELRIAKPPLPTWITAVARMAGGNRDNNLVMRLPAGLAASLMIFSLWGLVRALSKDRLLPLMAAAILATCVIIIDNGRRGSWDIYCHSFMLVAIWALAYGWQQKTKTSAAFLLAGLFLAFSFMSKGPVSFYGLLLPFLGAYFLTFGYGPVIKKWKWLCVSIILLVGLSSLWPFYIYVIHPEALKFIASKEVTAWADRHVQPFYFYLSFPVYTGVWAVLAIAGFFRPYAKKRVDYYGRYMFVLLWIILSLFLLSIIPEKKERYLMPAMVPIAIMAGYLFRSLMRVFHQQVSSRGDRRLLNAQMVLTCFASLAMPVVLYVFGVRNGGISVMAAAAWSIAFLFITGLIWIYGRQRRAGKLFALTVILVCLINLVMPPVIYHSPLFRNNPEYESLRGVRDLKGLAGSNYYHIGKISPQEVWDIGSTVKTIDSNGATLPLKDLPIVVFSDMDPSSQLPDSLKRRLRIDVLAMFKYHPGNIKKVKYVTRVQWANEREAENFSLQEKSK